MDGNRYIDGVSSLWCNVHGHAHPRIDAAVREQLGKVAHSTMLGLSHRPAIELARRLVELAPPGLTRVFYSDSGSTAIEIALKMAFQYWRQRGQERRRFVALEMAYHGDTLGAVSVGGISLFHSLYEPLLFEVARVAPGDVAASSAARKHGDEVAAVIMEPLVQGAAGMLMHPPGYLRAVRDLCDRHGVLLILDEVATGFGRTERCSPASTRASRPTSCAWPRASPAAICRSRPRSPPRRSTRLPRRARGVRTSSTATPTQATRSPARPGSHRSTCSARSGRSSGSGQDRAAAELLEPVAAHPSVKEVRRCGFMVGIELEEHPLPVRIGHRVTLEARRRGAIVRPLGDVVVLMPPLSISSAELQRLVEITAEAIDAATESASMPAAA